MKLLIIGLLLLLTACSEVIVRDENGRELLKERQERYREAHQKN